nr:MAG TPA: hypothetical protein [Caudoviricetes sp.]
MQISHILRQNRLQTALSSTNAKLENGLNWSLAQSDNKTIPHRAIPIN